MRKAKERKFLLRRLVKAGVEKLVVDAFTSNLEPYAPFKILLRNISPYYRTTVVHKISVKVCYAIEV